MVSKRDVAMLLARKHYDIEPGVSRIFEILDMNKDETAPDTPIKLLEVNDATVPSGIMPLFFAPVPTSGIPYPTVIVEVTPEEFGQLESNELALPKGWLLGAEMPRGEN